MLRDGLATAVSLGAGEGALTARVDDPALVPGALATLTTAGVEIDAFSYGQPSLDQVFLALTRHGAGPTPATHDGKSTT